MLVFSDVSFYSNLTGRDHERPPHHLLPTSTQNCEANNIIQPATAMLYGAGLLCCLLCNGSHAAAQELQRAPEPKLEGYEWTFPTMGTRMSLTAYAADKKIAKAAFDAAEARVREIASTLSDYDRESETSLLTTAAYPGPENVSEDLWNVLVASEKWYKRTDGAFDSSLGSVTRLWRKYRRSERIPSQDELQKALSSTGWSNVHLEAKTQSICLKRPDIKLDFGGIGKGYAVDEAFGVLQDFGVHRCLVNLSGNMRAGEPPPGREAWRIEIAPVQRGEKPLRRIAVANTALATSGDLWQFIEIDGIRRSHVLDPKTGYGVPGPTSVTAIAETALDADALATAACILPRDKAIRLCERWLAAALLANLKDGQRRVLTTPNFPNPLP
ncbi:MAG: FAD:protein FMN transferase [Pirellulaceae bacterium]